MTISKLKARFARLGPIRDIDRVPSGSPEVVVLSLSSDLSRAKTIQAVFALRKRGVPTLKAKRAVEAVIEGKNAVLDAPLVEDAQILAAELRDAGFALATIPKRPVDVKRLRERLGLTQEQFALRYGLELAALRNWEHGRREPDAAARSYLAVIERDPQRAQEALAVPVL